MYKQKNKLDLALVYSAFNFFSFISSILMKYLNEFILLLKVIFYLKIIKLLCYFTEKILMFYSMSYLCIQCIHYIIKTNNHKCFKTNFIFNSFHNICFIFHFYKKNISFKTLLQTWKIKFNIIYVYWETKFQ